MTYEQNNMPTVLRFEGLEYDRIIIIKKRVILEKKKRQKWDGISFVES